MIGYHIDDETVTNILRRLGLDVTFDNGQWQADVPSYRFDIRNPPVASIGSTTSAIRSSMLEASLLK